MNNTTPARLSDLNQVFTTFISIILGLLGVAVLVMFLIAGFQYLSAGGDKEMATRAKNTLTFAVMGLVLAISAWMIISLLGTFLGYSNFGIFDICFTAGCK